MKNHNIFINFWKLIYTTYKKSNSIKYIPEHIHFYIYLKNGGQLSFLVILCRDAFKEYLEHVEVVLLGSQESRISITGDPEAFGMDYNTNIIDVYHLLNQLEIDWDKTFSNLYDIDLFTQKGSPFSNSAGEVTIKDFHYFTENLKNINISK